MEMKRVGIIPVLYDILSSSYGHTIVISYKRRVLTELCSVVGQMCNDEETREMMCDTYQVIDCLLWIFDAAGTATKLMSKVIFALKQLCANNQENKDQVGARVIKTIV